MRALQLSGSPSVYVVQDCRSMHRLFRCRRLEASNRQLKYEGILLPGSPRAALHTRV